MKASERYEEHRRRVDEILTRAEVNHHRNMWWGFAASIVGGTVGFALTAGLLDSAVHHVPWNWEEAGIRAAVYIGFCCVFWAGLMWWDRRTNPLRRR